MLNVFASVNATNYQRTFFVPKTPTQFYDAITRVTERWTINTKGNTKEVGD